MSTTNFINSHEIFKILFKKKILYKYRFRENLWEKYSFFVNVTIEPSFHFIFTIKKKFLAKIDISQNLKELISTVHFVVSINWARFQYNTFVYWHQRNDLQFLFFFFRFSSSLWNIYIYKELTYTKLKVKHFSKLTVYLSGAFIS